MANLPTHRYYGDSRVRFSIVTALAFVLCGVAALACSCGNGLSVPEAQRRAPFPLYLPSWLPSGINPTPTILEYDSSLYDLEVYYYRAGEQSISPVLRLDVSSFSEMSSIWPWDPYTPSAFQEVVQLPNGHIVGIMSPGQYECWHMKGPEETECHYEPVEFLGVKWPGEEAWYTMYSTLSLTDTLAIIVSMQAVNE